MALFKKNPNEANYATGKKNWADVIKSAPGTGNLLAWRQPEEDFNTNSTLIVMPGEKAIFIKGGNIEQEFTEGTYKLSTENYPFISRLRNVASGGVSVFNCVVYFIRNTVSMQVYWGTKGPIIFEDENIGDGQTVEITARGSYNVKVAEATIFLKELLGHNVGMTAEELELFFDGRFTESIVSSIQETLEDKNTIVYRVISKLKDFSRQIEPYIAKHLDEYGLELENFSIIDMQPDAETKKWYNELRRVGLAEQRLMEKEADGKAYARVANAGAAQREMDILGDNWGREQSRDILKSVADNPGAGGVASAGAGLGMGMAAGGMFGNMAAQMFTPMQQQQPVQQAPPAPSGRFTQAGAASAANGAASAQAAEDPVATLKKLKDMLDMGLIQQAEFDAKKSEIMSRM